MEERSGTPIYVELANIHDLLSGMSQLCQGMRDGLFSHPLTHYISMMDEKGLMSAYDCLLENFNTLGGAFQVMQAATNIICDALENGDLMLVPGDGEAGWKVCIV